MTSLRIIIAVLSFLLLAAHFLRTGEPGLFLACASAPLLLFIKRRWAINILCVLLAAGSVLWVHAAMAITVSRMELGVPWLRPLVIMPMVTIVTLFSALFLLPLKKISRYTADHGGEAPSTAAFILTAAVITAAKLKASFPVLMLDRFFPGSGWLELLILAGYSAWLTDVMLRVGSPAQVRSRIWTVFSLVFFAQLLLGLAGMDIFFMTGKLHVPVPAVIIGGPVYRGGGLFMPILFASALILAGPAWCSYLCYFGAWDNNCSRVKKRPGVVEPWMKITRIAMLMQVTGAALLLRYFNVPPLQAAMSAVAFGVAGAGVMIVISRKHGIMAHCLAWCPLGLMADIFGKASPFRVRINDDCTECGACRNACRYGALEKNDIRRRRPGFTCTLCGDCITSCSKNAINYRLPWMQPDTARRAFIVIVISLHACFLGLARI
jgi:ferredoxin